MMHSVIIKDRVYRLRDSITLQIDRLDDGTIFVSYQKLSVHGYGRTYTTALETFCEMFDFQYRALVECDESELTDQAKILRAQFILAVERVHEMQV